MTQDGETRGEWVAEEKAGARLRHEVVCLNVPKRTNDRIDYSKRAVLARSP